MKVFNQLNCYAIGWFHLSQVKSTNCAKKYQPIEFIYDQTILTDFSKSGENNWDFLVRNSGPIWKNYLFLNHIVCNSWVKDLWILEQVFLGFEAWKTCFGWLESHRQGFIVFLLLDVSWYDFISISGIS